MAWINCGLDQGMKVVKGWPLRGTLFSVVVWTKAQSLEKILSQIQKIQKSQSPVRGIICFYEDLILEWIFWQKIPKSSKGWEILPNPNHVEDFQDFLGPQIKSSKLCQSMKVVKGLRKTLHPSELMAWINCGLDIGMKVIKGSPLRGTLFSVVVWIKAWKLSRVRGNYYILQNSWLGYIVVWIKAWKLSREEIITSFRTHNLDKLWFGSRHESRQGVTALRNTCSTDHLFSCSDKFVQLFLFNGQLFNSIFVQLSNCLFVRIIFVQLNSCSIVFFNWPRLNCILLTELSPKLFGTEF